MIWEKEIHFCRCFGFWRELKNYAHTVKHKFFAGKCDVCCRREQTRRTHWHTCAQPTVNVTGRSRRKHWTELIRRTPTHCRTCNHVLPDGLVQETNWCNNLATTSINICLCRHTKHTTEVVGMRVRENHHRGWKFFNMLIHQLERSTCGVLAGQRINDHPPICSANKRDV